MSKPEKVEKTVQPEAPKVEKVTEEEKVLKMKVAPGKSVTSKRGVLDAGEIVTEKDFPGGLDSITELFSNETLVSVE